MQPLSSEFKEFIGKQLPGLAPSLIEALETTPPSVSIRLNPRKTHGQNIGIASGAVTVPWCGHGLYLPERPDFTHDPAMHQGIYYVQDASSMITSHVVAHLVRLLDNNKTRPGESAIRYLDACAAPGGKTTAAIDSLPDGSFVVANEFDFRRAEILKENIMKWGYPHIAVTRGDTARFRNLPGWFDIVAADVPCSGEGMMRKDETARSQWNTGLVAECAERQREILGNLWAALRPGGYLVYSTCTFNTTENEENIAWLTQTSGAIPVSIPLPASAEGIIISPTGGMRFIPGRIHGEGLFMAVLQKPGSQQAGITPAITKKQRKATTNRTGKNNPLSNIPPAATSKCARWVDGDFPVQCNGETLYAIHDADTPLLQALQQHLDIIHQGIGIGTVKGRSVIPSQGLALSLALKQDAFPSAEADLPTALAYLRRESLPGFDAPRGHLLLTHNGHPLGFVNHLGNRSNNLYPANWRILH